MHIYNGILFSHKKENKIMPFATTLVDLEIVILSEVSKTWKDKYLACYILNIKKKKKTVQISLFTKQSRVTDMENKHGNEGLGRRDKLGNWNCKYTLLYIK